MLAHLTEACVNGNLVFAYAVKTGRATMIEAVIAQFPFHEVGGASRAESKERNQETTKNI